WWHDATATLDEVMRRAQSWIGTATVVEHQPKRWRMATPRTTWPERCWSSDGITLAGDAFAGPKIEGAVLSGLAAAEYVGG
ncbi:MAG: NAD/FAD-dependent oxidoreductase, partial [Actinomycetota bacterium]